MRDPDRRVLTRLERRAVAAYEHDLLEQLRELALIEATVTSVSTRSDGLGSIFFHLSGRTLVLAGVTPLALTFASALADSTHVRLTETGRYGPSWWVTLYDGTIRTVLLGARAYLTPDSGGLKVETAQLVA